MGCCSSKSAAHGEDVDIPEVRRRLSLGSVGDGEDDGGETDEERSLLVQLSNEQLLDLISEAFQGDRKYSIGSETDSEMNRKSSFSQKTIQTHGDSFTPEKEGLGYACKKGLKPEAPNQDSFFVLKIEGRFSVYGVFDGHGRKGHDISNFVKDQLPKILIAQEDIESDTLNALKMAFSQTQRMIEKATQMKRIDAERSGTTATVVVHHHVSNMLFIAHVGDSRCVLGKRATTLEGERPWDAVDLTVDHKPNNPEERDRIEKAGGVVLFDGHYNYRVYAKTTDHRGKRYPGLNMSRTLGDLLGYYDAGLSCVPDVGTQKLGAPKKVETAPDGKPDDDSILGPEPALSSHSIDPLTDFFLLICSDGVWEFLESQEAVRLCAKYPPTEAMTAAHELATEAWDKWMHNMQGCIVDDITAVCIHLHTHMPSSGALMAQQSVEAG